MSCFRIPSALWCCAIITLLVVEPIVGHDHTRQRAAQRLAEAEKEKEAAAASETGQELPRGKLTIRLRDAVRGDALAGLVRVTDVATDKAIPLPAEIHRALNWYSVPAEVTIDVPQTKLRIEAVHGIETELARQEVDLSGRAELSVDVPLVRLYDPHGANLRSGNTHLHLMKLTYDEAVRYLQLVPRSDGLDLVFLSHLRRVPDEREYITNQIVENSFVGGELQRLSQHGVLFANGQEHRHNFGRYGEGYGHVLLLDLLKLIHPVSIGPAIMQDGTDGRPLQLGIREARDDGATVVWAHNASGFEDVPNWVAGVLDAQNIFDGDEGNYQDSFYKYLNLGMHVPFSTGTDWFIYDFSRVYIPIEGSQTSDSWLRALRDGRTFITNGTFLEFSVNDRRIGDTISLDTPGRLMVKGRAVGRNDFRGLELVHNGEVIQARNSRRESGHFTASLEYEIDVDQPGWLALRIPLETGKNELDRPLFAHTSPVYIELAGRRIFRREVASQLIEEIRAGIKAISDQGIFASDAERESVLQVHHAGIAELERWLSLQ